MSPFHLTVYPNLAASHCEFGEASQLMRTQINYVHFTIVLDEPATGRTLKHLASHFLDHLAQGCCILIQLLGLEPATF